MIDLSQFKPHVQEALQEIDWAANAAGRVSEGVKWLNAHAPIDWRLQMMSIWNGKIHSNVRMCRNDENALALAFRRINAFKGPDGRVTWATLMSHPGIMSRFEAERRGFVEISYHAPNNVFIDSNIDGLFLDDAWATALGEYHERFGQPVQEYPQAVEQAYMLKLAVRRLAVA